MITRREWLAQMALMAGTLSVASPGRLLADTLAPEKEAGDLYLFSYERITTGPADNRPYGLCVIWNRRKNTFTRVPTAGYIHSYTPFPGDPSRALGVGKRNGFAGVLDLRQSRITSSFEPTPGCTPNGHVAFSRDGKEVFISEMEKGTGQGKIVVRGSQCLKVLREFSSFGGRPHELAFHPDGETLMVANFSGGAEFDACNFAMINFKTGKLVKRFEAGRPARGGHFHLSKDGWVIYGGVGVIAGTKEDECPGLIWVIEPGGKARWLEAPAPHKAAFLGEAATISVDEGTGTVYGITRAGAGILAWNFRTGAFMGQFQKAGTAGLAQNFTGGLETVATQTIDATTSSAIVLRGSGLDLRERHPFPLESYQPNPHVLHLPVPT